VFPIQECGFLSKVKEIRRLCGDVAGYIAQTNAPIDAEIGQKDHLWMKTSEHRIYFHSKVFKKDLYPGAAT